MRHGALFRVEITTADGQSHAVTLQVDTHRKVPSKAAINDLADRWRLPRNMVDAVLGEWTPDRLRNHLSSLTRDELVSREPVLELNRAVS